MFISLEASLPRWMALLVALSLVACRTETPPAEEPAVIEPTVMKVPDAEAPKVTGPGVPSLFLELRSTKGEIVSKATVQTASGKTAQTNTSGQLLLERLQPGLQLLRVRAPDFSPSLVALHLKEGVQAGASLELLPLGEPIPFDASEEADLKQGDVHVTVPQNALFDKEGRLIQGNVNAYLAMLNLDEGELLAAPGLLEGILTPGGETVGLESLGMVVIIFEQDGEVIPFAKRIRFRGRGPGSIRAGSEKPLPGTVPTWRLEQSSGQWSPTGDLGLIKESTEPPGTYEWDVMVDNPSPVLNVALPYWWRSEKANPANPLQPPEPRWVETACLAVRVEEKGGQPGVKGKEGQPVAGLTVVARGVGYMGVSRGVTDGSGLVLLEVMRKQLVDLDAGGQLKRVSTGTDAGPCTGPEAKPVPITLKVAPRTCTPGEARDCSYSGPEGTLDVGACRAARQYCDANGTGWSNTCKGEVLPQEEQCGTVQDDDCDGATNEECQSICEEGDKKPCEGEGTKDVGICRVGTQECVAGGTAWGACEEAVHPEAAEDCSRPGDEDCDGVTCLCWPGQVQKCDEYGGPAGTEGVGLCHASTRTCKALGAGWDDCTGEVTPLPEEDCTTPGDDDCDGEANETSVCVCVPNSSQRCYSGEAGEGVGLCHAGTKTCNSSGTAWGACIGEVTPLPEEDCTTPGDDDCDGTVNEGTVCICTPNSTQSCYSRSDGTEGVGVCRAGTETCNASGTAWGACTGEVTPQGEICTNDVDDDCDGQTDEDPPCGWVAAASMSSPRYDHSATLLSDGRVLVVGGDTGGNWALKTAEVYDPASNTWSPIDSMDANRSRHTATLLSNGKVLVAGGYNGNDEGQSFATAEVYDPASNTWTYTNGPMSSHRRKHSATLLSNGKVLVAGGWENDGSFDGRLLKTAEVYDPASNTWSPVSAMTSARNRHTATLLNDGKVLVAGGHNNSINSLAAAEVYDPASNTWSDTNNPMSSARRGHTATLLSNGKVLVAGGLDASDNALGTAEVYDPATNTWSPVRHMPSPRGGHTATLLSNGKVLVAGGQVGNDIARAEAEVYDPASNTWSSINALASPHFLHTETLLNTGQVLVTGGKGSSELGTVEVYPGPVTSTAP